MKYIILERLSPHRVLAISSSGQVKRIYNKWASVGEEIELSPYSLVLIQQANYKNLLALGVLLLFFTFSYTFTFGSIDMDMGARITLNYNIYNRVIASYARNEKGQELLNVIGNDLLHHEVKKAFFFTADYSVNQTLTNKDTFLVVASVPSTLANQVYTSSIEFKDIDFLILEVPGQNRDYHEKSYAQELFSDEYLFIEDIQVPLGQTIDSIKESINQD